MNKRHKTRARYLINNLIRYGDSAYFSSRYMSLALSIHKKKLDNLFIEDHMRTLFRELKKNYERV